MVAETWRLSRSLSPINHCLVRVRRNYMTAHWSIYELKLGLHPLPSFSSLFSRHLTPHTPFPSLLSPPFSSPPFPFSRCFSLPLPPSFTPHLPLTLSPARVLGERSGPWNFLAILAPENTSDDNRCSSFLLLMLVICLLKAHKDSKKALRSINCQIPISPCKILCQLVKQVQLTFRMEAMARLPLDSPV